MYLFTNKDESDIIYSIYCLKEGFSVKKIVSFLLAAIIVFSLLYLPVFADDPFDFMLSSDKSYYILSSYSGNDVEVTVPSSYKDLPVKEISDGAFAGNVSTYKITIPNTITKIGVSAFCGTPSLYEFESSGNYVSDGGVLFTSDKKTLVAFPQGREGDYIIGSNVETLSARSFYNSSLSNIVFNSKITEVPDYAFYGSALTSVTLPSNITLVSTRAFQGSALKSVKIEGGAALGEYAFSFCTDLIYAELSGAVFSGSGTFCGCYSLIASDFKTDQKLPKYTFSGCTALITAPTGHASEIGSEAFYGCVSLQNAYLPNGSAAATDAFGNCDRLNGINYSVPDEISAKVDTHVLKAGREFEPEFECDGEYDLYTDSDILSIENGVIRAEREGTAHIIAVSRKGGAAAVITIEINDGITVAETAHPYKAGSYEYTVSSPGAARTAVTFSSAFSFMSYDSLTVKDKNGNVYGHYSGNSLAGKTLFIESDTAVLNVEAPVGGAYGFRIVSVCSAESLTKMTSISMPDHIELNAGESAELNAYPVPSDAVPSEIIYVTSDPYVAAVDRKGRVTALGGGTAVITAYSTAYGVSSACSVTVHENVFNGFVYETKSEEAAIVYYKGTDRNCVIPSVINGSTVTGINERAFAFTDITSVTIPKTVRNINVTAFDGCASLLSINVESGSEIYSSVDGVLTSANKMILIKVPCGISGAFKIPSQVTFSGSNAFDHCYFITSIDVNNVSSFSASGVKYCPSLSSYSCSGKMYKSVDGVLYTSNKKTLTAYPPAKNTGIFSIPEGTEKIDACAFNSNPSLFQINIPASVTAIDPSAFAYQPELSLISVAAANTNFYTSNGVLYEGTTLKCVPAVLSGVIKVKNGTENIGRYAFYGCEKVVSAILPDSLTTIGRYAFCGCKELELLVYPPSMTKTEQNAYDGCDKLSVFIPDDYEIEYDYGCKILCGKNSKAENSCVNKDADHSFAYLSENGAFKAVTEADVELKFRRVSDRFITASIDSLTAYESFGVYSITFEHGNSRTACGNAYIIDANGFFGEDTLVYEKGSLYSLNFNNGILKTDSDLILALPDGACNENGKLSLCKAPDKTVYDPGETIDLSGIELYYTDPKGKTCVVTEDIDAVCDLSTPGIKTVTVSYMYLRTTFTVTVRENVLTGTVTISGSCVYGSTLTCDTSNVKPQGLTFNYQWYSGENEISGAVFSAYTVRASDIGKQIRVMISATSDVTGFLMSDPVTADKAKADPPPKPKVLKLTPTSVTLVTVEGCEYRLSGQSSYSASTEFTGLTPGRNYTFYQRVKETDTHYASERTSLTVSMPSENRLQSDVYRLNSNNGILSLAEPQTSVDAFLKNFKNDSGVSVYKNGSEIKGTSLVGTGCEVRLYGSDGKLIESYKIAITGDVNGDGKVSMTDYLQIKERIIKNKVLDTPNEYACDVNGDGKITMTDYLRLKYCIQGHEKLIQNEY